MKNKLHSLTKQPFTWIDWINIVKSFITSQFLFLAQMLPIDIPKKDLQDWQHTLTTLYGITNITVSPIKYRLTLMLEAA